MSTLVNIIVRGLNLVDIIRQAQAAARERQLEKERMKRLEEEAIRLRNLQLLAEGKNPDGSPLESDTSKRSPLEREPAANGGIEIPIGFFWLQDTAVIVDGLQYQKIILASGDRSEVAEATFENPTTSSYLTATRPTGILPPAPSEWPYSTTGNWGSNLDFLYGVPQLTDFPIEAKSYTKLNGSGGTIYSEVGDLIYLSDPTSDPPGVIRSFYAIEKRSKHYAIYPKAASVTRSVILPLGKEVALYAQYYAGKARHDYLTIEEAVLYTPVSLDELTVNGVSGGYLTTEVSYNISSEITSYSPKEFEECICFIVSKKRVKRITTPPLLLEQFRKLVGTVSETAETIYYGIPNDAIGSLPPGNPSYSFGVGTLHQFTGNKFTHPLTGSLTPGYTFLYSSPSFIREGVSVFPQTEPAYCEYSEYGLTYEGLSEDDFKAGTPLSWYFIDSHEAATSIRDAETHEDIRDITSEGIPASVGSNLRYKNYIGLPDNVRSKLQDSEVKIFQGRGKEISGPLDEANYPYKTIPPNLPTWKPAGIIKKTGLGPSILSSLYFIYDWGKPNFCKGQADRYGITLEALENPSP